MKRFIAIGTAALALAVPVAASAAAQPSANSLAVQSCKTQQAQLGAATFKSTYGANAYGKCVSKGVRAAQATLQNASQQCTTEQADANFAATHENKTFDAFYGTPSKGKGGGSTSDAFGKCVSAKAKASSQQQTQRTIAAAKACKAELAASKTTFATTYGAKANAFGKCVSRKANAKS